MLAALTFSFSLVLGYLKANDRESYSMYKCIMTALKSVHICPCRLGSLILPALSQVSVQELPSGKESHLTQGDTPFLGGNLNQ